MLNANGILIQGLDEHTDFINNFVYDGINAYFRFPLTAFCDSESRDLTSEQQSKKISGDSYAILEFISDYGLYERYVKKCNELGIKFRALFIESNPVPVKTAMNIMGLPSGPLREPLAPMKEENVEVLKKALKDSNLI